MAAGVWIAGTAMTAFGRRPDRDLVALAVEACEAALDDAGIDPADVDALYFGNFLGQTLQGQGVLASMIARRVGVGNVPTTSVEGACASAAIALRHGRLAIAADAAEVALCVGGEHMTSFDTATVTAGLAQATDQTSDGQTGLTFPGFFGLVASAYLARFGVTRDELSSVPVKSRRHAAGNPMVMFDAPVTTGDVVSARPIADPLRLLDCSPISDGAAAAVVVREPRPGAVRVLACEQASGAVAIGDIADLLTFPATTTAATAAYAAAGLAAADVDVVELHDCFSIAELVDAEDLGLLPIGEAAQATAAGATTNGGSAATINPSGGLLARGHPVGATGLAQIHELVQQLRGDAHNQVAGARVGLAHNLGGCGATAMVTILAG